MEIFTNKLQHAVWQCAARRRVTYFFNGAALFLKSSGLCTLWRTPKRIFSESSKTPGQQKNGLINVRFASFGTRRQAAGEGETRAKNLLPACSVASAIRLQNMCSACKLASRPVDCWQLLSGALQLFCYKVKWEVGEFLNNFEQF